MTAQVHRVIFGNPNLNATTITREFPKGVVIKARALTRGLKEVWGFYYHGPQIVFPPHFDAVHS